MKPFRARLSPWRFPWSSDGFCALCAVARRKTAPNGQTLTGLLVNTGPRSLSATRGRTSDWPSISKAGAGCVNAPVRICAGGAGKPAFLPRCSSHVASHPRARGQKSGDRVHVINYHHVIHALKRKPGALANLIYRDSLFPRTEYVLVWRALQASLSRRDACRRMVDILFLAHEENAEAELANLMADDLRHGHLSDARDLKALLVPRDHSLPTDVVVNLPALSCFDALLEATG